MFLKSSNYVGKIKTTGVFERSYCSLKSFEIETNFMTCLFLFPAKFRSFLYFTKLSLALSCAKKIDRDPKVSESPSVKSTLSIKTNAFDSIVATRVRAVAAKITFYIKISA